jgi:hypothetical protein
LEAIPGLWVLSLQTYNTSEIYDASGFTKEPFGNIDRTEQWVELQLVELILPYQICPQQKQPSNKNEHMCKFRFKRVGIPNWSCRKHAFIDFVLNLQRLSEFLINDCVPHHEPQRSVQTLDYSATVRLIKKAQASHMT